MGFHFFLIIVAICAIIYIQFRIYNKTKLRIKFFETLFPESSSDEFVIVDDSDGIGKKIVSKKEYDSLYSTWKTERDKLEALMQEKRQTLDELADFSDDPEYQKIDEELRVLRHTFEQVKEPPVNYGIYKSANYRRNIIVSSINSYLEKNNSVASDFYLVKDIVDRNSDAEEEAIVTQIPMPLYCGLMGTMIGIIIGVLYLWLSGGLSELLGSDASVNGASGIEALLGGVALAMISSIFGIVLTTMASWKEKECKYRVESLKHGFLSWIQSELLPVMNTDALSSMRMLFDNLSDFNKAFKENSDDLKVSLEMISESSKDQASLLNAINKLKIDKIASANIAVYDKLSDATEEIAKFSDYMLQVNTYLNSINDLCDKLDASENRIRTIEEMGAFFKEERANLDSIKGIIAKSLSSADDYYSSQMAIFEENINKRNDELKVCLVKNNDSIQTLLDGQDEAINNRSNEIDKVVKEIQQLSAIEKLLANLENSTQEQTKKIDRLITKLSSNVNKQSGGSGIDFDSIKDKWLEYPTWAKAVVGGAFVWVNVWMILLLYLLL